MLCLALAAAVGGAAFAEVSPPAWMPGSPLLAGSQVIVLWLPVPGAVKYVIYLDGKKAGESPTVQFILQSPETAGEHKIEIASVDTSGKEGAKGKSDRSHVVL